MRRHQLISGSALVLGLLLFCGMIVAVGLRGPLNLVDSVPHTDEVEVLRDHSQPITCVALSRDGTLLASGSYDKTVKLWDTRTGQLLMTLDGYGAPISSVALSPDGALLASQSANVSVRLWDVAAGQERAPLGTLPGAKILGFGLEGSLTFSGDGKTLAAAVCTVRPNGSVGWVGYAVAVWDVSTGALIRTIAVGPGWVALTPDGKTLAVTDHAQVRLFEVSTGRERVPLKCDSGVGPMAISGDGKTLAVVEGDRDGPGEFSLRDLLKRRHRTGERILLWDLTAGRQTAAVQEQAALTRSVIFATEAGTLATGSSDGTIRLWDIASRQELLNFQEHNGSPSGVVAITPDGKTLASGRKDGTIRLWDVPKLLKQKADQQ